MSKIFEWLVWYGFREDKIQQLLFIVILSFVGLCTHAISTEDVGALSYRWVDFITVKKNGDNFELKLEVIFMKIFHI